MSDEYEELLSAINERRYDREFMTRIRESVERDKAENLMADDLDTPRRSNPLKAQHIAAGRKTDPSVMADDLDLDALNALAEKCYGGWLVVAASDDVHPDVTAGVVRLVRTVPALIAELRALRSQLAESQRENQQLRLLLISYQSRFGVS